MAIKSIVANYQILRKPCQKVEPKDNVREIIKDLKDTLATTKGIGLAANQIGYDKRVCYVKVPTGVDKNKQILLKELIMINPKIIEKADKIKVIDSCLSFPGLKVQVLRYIFITVQYENEKREILTEMYQDLVGLAVQHEIAHLNGRTILDDKYQNRNT